jgi:hypothetical protein
MKNVQGKLLPSEILLEITPDLFIDGITVKGRNYSAISFFPAEGISCWFCQYWTEPVSSPGWPRIIENKQTKNGHLRLQ